MASASTFTLDTYEFPNKSQAKAFVKQLLADSRSTHGLRERLPNSTQQILYDLVQYCDDKKQQELSEIDYFVLSAQQGSTCFAVKKTDDTYVCFSYNTALDVTLRSPENLATKAARIEITPQTEQFRAMHTTSGMGVCVLTGNTLPSNMLHVDHHFDNAPFGKLWTAFLEIRGLHAKDIETRSSDSGRLFIDRELANAWSQYHEEHAVLRLVRKEDNLRM